MSHHFIEQEDAHRMQNALRLIYQVHPEKNSFQGYAEAVQELALWGLYDDSDFKEPCPLDSFD